MTNGVDKELFSTYWERGWVVVPNVFPVEDVEAISKLATAVATADVGNGTIDSAEVESSGGGFAPRKVMNPFTKDPAFARFALSKKLRGLLEAIVGKPVLLASDQIFLKPPLHGSAKPYHQDNAYFRCTPGDEVITAWIALDDVDEANGCLRYIDGSHRLPILEHHKTEGESYNLQPAASAIDLSNESLAPVGKGGVVLHHSHTLHTSHRNTSDRWRRGYATHWVTSDVVSESATIERAYFVAEAERYGACLQM